MVMVNGLLFVAATLSVTWTVKVNVPEAEGVPVILPSEFTVRPVGVVPERREKVYGVVPPVAET